MDAIGATGLDTKRIESAVTTTTTLTHTDQAQYDVDASLEAIIDAVNAARAAQEEGVVKGGGLALKEVAEELGKDSILYSTLMAPYNRIRENAGKDLEITDKILDPLKVVRLALENACSGAGILITSDGAIAEKKMTYGDFLEKAMRKVAPHDERDDWRDDENQDQGRSQIV